MAVEKSPKLKAVLFDLDMTLIDFMGMKREASRATARAMVRAGLKMKPEEAERMLFETYMDEGIESDTAFTRFLKENSAYSERALAAALNAYLKVKQMHLKPYPDVRLVLKQLKGLGLKLGIVTDAPRLKAWQRLDAMGIAGMFDAVVGFEDTNRKKPDSLPFKKALKLLGAKPMEALHVGDWPERDIKGAKALGIKACLARYGLSGSVSKGENSPDAKADFEILEFKDLLAVVRKLRNGKRI